MDMPRRSRRRSPTYLLEDKRLEVAEKVFAGVPVKEIIYEYSISGPYVTRIKQEFLEARYVWIKGPKQGQFSLPLHEGRSGTLYKK